MTVEDVIRKAISEKRAIALSYDDDDRSARTVHPHVLYRTTTGKICLDGYQTDGPSSSGQPLPDWRIFNTARILSVDMLDRGFDLAPGLNLSSSRYSNGILAHV